MITDEDINKYINESFTEQVIQNYENQILHVMKTLYEKYPCDKYDAQWLNYTNFVYRRRCQTEHEKD